MGQFFNASGIYANYRRKEWTSSRVLASSHVGGGVSASLSSSSGRFVPPVDFRTIVGAHIGMDSTYELTVDLIYSEYTKTIGKKELSDDAMLDKFWLYFRKYPHLRQYRYCTLAPGECRICDESFVTRAEKLVGGDSEEKPISRVPFASSTPIDQQGVPLESHKRRQRDGWFSQRPCHEFLLKRTCRYGWDCRFNHCISPDVSKPPPMIRSTPILGFGRSYPHAPTPVQSPAFATTRINQQFGVLSGTTVSSMSKSTNCYLRS